MTKISEHIERINSSNRKVLSIYLTAGFPKKETFVDLALAVLDSGADMLEIGVPFSDPLADGPVIQYSSHVALENSTTMTDVLHYCEKIKSKTEKPLLLMGYANPILKYGIKNFCKDAVASGIVGLIAPDVPLDEYESFYSDDFNCFDKILLTTPTSPDERIKQIDKKSEGFVYCVSVKGTTGARSHFDESVYKNLQRTYTLTEKNKMLIGFGISSPESVKKFSPFCDGVIIGSAVIKKIDETKNISEVGKFVNSLSEACNM